MEDLVLFYIISVWELLSATRNRGIPKVGFHRSKVYFDFNKTNFFCTTITNALMN